MTSQFFACSGCAVQNASALTVSLDGTEALSVRRPLHPDMNDSTLSKKRNATITEAG